MQFSAVFECRTVRRDNWLPSCSAHVQVADNEITRGEDGILLSFRQFWPLNTSWGLRDDPFHHADDPFHHADDPFHRADDPSCIVQCTLKIIVYYVYFI